MYPDIIYVADPNNNIGYTGECLGPLSGKLTKRYRGKCLSGGRAPTHSLQPYLQSNSPTGLAPTYIHNWRFQIHNLFHEIFKFREDKAIMYFAKFLDAFVKPPNCIFRETNYIFGISRSPASK